MRSGWVQPFRRPSGTVGAAVLSLGLGLGVGPGVLAPSPARAAGPVTVYVSPAGTDTAPGTSPGQAWRTAARVQQGLDAGALPAGSQVLFERGGRYPGGLSFRATSSGAAGAPLVVSAYGTGAPPVLTRAVRLTGWEPSGPNRWTAPCPGCAARPAGLSIGGTPQRLARWPNAGAAGGGYRSWTASTGGTSLTDPGLPAGTTWVGAEAVVRSAAWVLDRVPVSARSGSTLTFGSPTTYPLQPGYGYFLQDHPAALDRPGEWVFDRAARTVTLVSATDPDGAVVEVTGDGPVVSLAGGSHDVTLRDLELVGGGAANLAGTGCARVAVSNVTSRFTGGTGIALTGCQDATVGHSRVRQALDLGVDLDGCARCRLHHTVVRDIALLAGLGGSDNGHYLGVRVGPADVVELNRVENIGYLGIDVRGSGAVVRQNVVRAFNRVKVDGGGIYTWHGSDITVQDNLVADAPGSTAGIPWASGATHGIYVDDDSQRVQVRGNTVSAVGAAGVYLHNTRDVAVTGNTLVTPGEAGLLLVDDDLGAFTVTGTTVTGNTVVLDRSAVPAVRAETSSSPPNTAFLAGLGTFSGNTYCGLFADPVFATRDPAGSATGFLAGWRAGTGQDTTSRSCGYRSATFTETGTTGTQRVGNGRFDTGIDGWFGWPDPDLQAGWDPAGVNGGSLRVADGGTAPLVHIDTRVGALAAGSTYRVTLTARSDAGARSLRAYLRRLAPPYTVLTPVETLPLDAAAAVHRLYLPVSVAEPDAILVVELDRTSRVAWLDDVTVQQVTGTPVGTGQVLRLETNPTAAPRTVTLDGAYTDPAGTAHPAGSTVTVPPFGALALLRR